MIPASALLAHLNTLDKDYWLAQSEGFIVRRGSRRIGVVAYPLFESSLVRPDVLIVRAGLPRRGQFRVDIGDVAAIDPRAKTIWLSERV
jgi:hypothetical protein